MQYSPKAYWLWLQQGLGAASRNVRKAVRAYGGLYHFFQAGAAQWEKDKILSREEILRLKFYSPAYGQALLEYGEKLGLFVTVPGDGVYPRQFHGLENPPCALFLEGDASLLSRPGMVLIGGSRKAGKADLLQAGRLGGSLPANGKVLLEGGMAGIEQAALEGALEAGGECISILACGLCYPYSEETLKLRHTGGKRLCISEYPPDTPAFPQHFAARNRLLLRLAEQLVVLGAEKGGGALKLAKSAEKQGVPVLYQNEISPEDGLQSVWKAREPSGFDLEKTVKKDSGRGPGAFSEGLSSPSQQTNPEEFPDFLQTSLSQGAKKLYAVLEKEPLSIGELAKAADLSVSKGLAAATELELLGLIRSFSGGRYGK